MPAFRITLPGRCEGHSHSCPRWGAGLLPFLLLLGCRPAPPPPIRIGLVAYQPTDLNGPATANAIQLAVEEANEPGGLLVGGARRRVEVRRLVILEGSPEQAVAAVQKLINQEKVSAIIGPQNSDEAIPAAGVANRSGIPLISPISSHALTTRDRPFVFRVCFRDDAQGKALARFARDVLKARTAALLVEVNVTYSRTIAEVFRQEFIALGGRIVADTTFTSREEELGRQFQEIRKSSADVLLLPNYHLSTLPVGIAARRAGIRSTFLGSDAWSPSLIRGVPEFDGSYMVTNWSPGLETEANTRFTAAYARRFQSEPTETAALTYDAARMLFAAVASTADGSPDAIRKALYRGPFAGTSGSIRYLANGDPEKAVVLLRFKNGHDQVAQVLPPGTGR
jgi:branched-chain amino acid transport system substrate-binding protein